MQIYEKRQQTRLKTHNFFREKQMTTAAYRQKLCYPLDDPENERFNHLLLRYSIVFADNSKT